MKYNIAFDKKFIKDLQRIPIKFRDGIQEKIEELKKNPRPEGSIKLKGSSKTPLYRIRQGDYRIIYTIHDSILLILIVEIGNRKEIYR